MQQVARDTLKQTHLLQLCIVVNNIKQLRLLILKLPVQLDWAQLEQRTGAVIDQRQIQHTLHSQLDSTVSCLDHEVRDVVKALATKVTPRHCSPLAPAWTEAGRCHRRGPRARGAPGRGEAGAEGKARAPLHICPRQLEKGIARHIQELSSANDSQEPEDVST